ncbi:MAG: ACT domain-containing protein [Pseudomonadota bacterium]
MVGEKDLETLLATMSPELGVEDYVFCTFPDASYGDFSELNPLATICESEGLTLIISKTQADSNNIEYESVFRRITLTIHSSLDAVGLTAAIADKLGQRGISANVVAAFYHDHFFVQSDLAAEAMEALAEFSA